MHLRRFSTIYMGNKSKSLETKACGTSQQQSTVSKVTLSWQTTVVGRGRQRASQFYWLARLARLAPY